MRNASIRALKVASACLLMLLLSIAEVSGGELQVDARSLGISVILNGGEISTAPRAEILEKPYVTSPGTTFARYKITPSADWSPPVYSNAVLSRIIPLGEAFEGIPSWRLSSALRQNEETQSWSKAQQFKASRLASSQDLRELGNQSAATKIGGARGVSTVGVGSKIQPLLSRQEASHVGASSEATQMESQTAGAEVNLDKATAMIDSGKESEVLETQAKAEKLGRSEETTTMLLGDAALPVGREIEEAELGGFHGEEMLGEDTGVREIFSRVPVSVPEPILQKYVNRSEIVPGGYLTYQLLFINETGRELTGLLVRDSIPFGTAYVDNSARPGGSGFRYYPESDNYPAYVEWTLKEPLPAEAGVQFEFRVRVAGGRRLR